jgi:hypothetical protein
MEQSPRPNSFETIASHHLNKSPGKSPDVELISDEGHLLGHHVGHQLGNQLGHQLEHQLEHQLGHQVGGISWEASSVGHQLVCVSSC